MIYGVWMRTFEEEKRLRTDTRDRLAQRSYIFCRLPLVFARTFQSSVSALNITSPLDTCTRFPLIIPLFLYPITLASGVVFGDSPPCLWAGGIFVFAWALVYISPPLILFGLNGWDSKAGTWWCSMLMRPRGQSDHDLLRTSSSLVSDGTQGRSNPSPWITTCHSPLNSPHD